MKLKVGDEKNLSKELIDKQRQKGTYDSPCMSICNYAGEHDQCKTCFMLKTEKIQWKVADIQTKNIILNSIEKRMES